MTASQPYERRRGYLGGDVRGRIKLWDDVTNRVPEPAWRRRIGRPRRVDVADGEVPLDGRLPGWAEVDSVGGPDNVRSRGSRAWLTGKARQVPCECAVGHDGLTRIDVGDTEVCRGDGRIDLIQVGDILVLRPLMRRRGHQR